MQEKIINIKSVLQNSTNIVITVHKSPDGDALGSALALSGVLSKLDHKVTVVSPNSYAPFLYWMKGNEDILIYSENIEEATKVTQNADIIFMLDYNHLSRIGDYSNVVRGSDAFKLMIDHHQEPEQDVPKNGDRLRPHECSSLTHQFRHPGYDRDDHKRSDHGAETTK